MAEVKDSDFVSGESCNGVYTKRESSLGEEIIEYEAKPQTVVSVAKGDDDDTGIKSDSISGGSSSEQKEEIIVSIIVEKKQEIDDESSVSIPENPVIVEKESFLGEKQVLFFFSASEVQESDKIDHILKPSEEDGKKLFGDLMSEPHKTIEVIIEPQTILCEKSSENFLGMGETHPLMESELGSIIEPQRTFLEDISSKNRKESIEEMVGSDCDKMKGFNGLENLEISVMAGPSSIYGSGNGFGKKGKGGKMNVKKDGKEEKKDKCPKRRAKGMKKVSEAQNVCLRRMGNGSKINYPKNELEAMRFVNVQGQRIMWNEIYNGLGSLVTQELKGMADSKNQKQGSKNVEHQKQGIVKKKENSPVLSEVCSQDLENNFTELNPLDISCGDYVNGNDNSSIVEGECTEEDSDSEYDAIQRLAFLVEGEPDFDSGPPQDGLEYLRRVRWEAAKIPKVEVAKLDWNKLSNDQTVYMPNIPEIAKCPEILLPMKQWEDAFLADFSELRMALSRMGSINPSNSVHLHSFLTPVEDYSCQHLGSMGHQTSECLQVPMTAEDDTSKNLKTSSPKNSGSSQSFLMNYEEDTNHPVKSCSLETSGKHQSVSASSPALSVILKMNPVSRVSMLKRHIDSFETASRLSRNHCEWLFALCATVDTPLDADMSASMRCLLRKCAGLRAGKSEVDDEVVMLNILVTISGRYFGQSEN